MVHNSKRWTRLALVLALALAGILTTAQSARAEGILYGSTIPAGTTIENDAILWGNNITVDGDVDGDVFAFGRTITIKGSVTGSLIAGGQTINVEGDVGGSTYSVGQFVGLGPEAAVGRTAYLVGVRVAVPQGVTVGRDLSVLALGAQLNGTVGRESRAVVGMLEFIEILTQNVNWQRGQLDLTEPSPDASAATPPDVLAAPALAGPAQFVNAALAPLPAAYVQGDAIEAQAADGVDAYAVQVWFLNRGRELLTLLIAGALALWLFRTPFEWWAERLRARPLPAAGLGVVSYVTGYAGPALLALLVFALGLALAAATFWTPAFIVWGLGFSALGLAFFAFLFFALYVSKAIVAYLVGYLLLKRWPRVARYRFLCLLLGIVLYLLLRSIPIFGWVLGFVVTFLGLGAVCLGSARLFQEKGSEECACEEVEVKAPVQEEPAASVQPTEPAECESSEACEQSAVPVEPAESADPEVATESNGMAEPTEFAEPAEPVETKD